MNITPDSNTLWQGIGGHFDSFSQMTSEFVDNIISNYDKNQSYSKSMLIFIDDIPHSDYVKVTIEDGGTGIINLEKALTLGDKSFQDTYLNEHGFEFKHALASADPKNSSWRICTRTKEMFSQGKYIEVTAPYAFEIQTNELDCSVVPWSGHYNSSGTIFEFNVSKDLFDTLYKGRANFETKLDYLSYDLGYIYSNVISEGRINIILKSNTHRYHKDVKAVLPVWEGSYFGPGEKVINLGGGEVLLKYHFGDIKDKHPWAMKYYQKNMSTSGVEVRINGRLLISNVFEEIWEKEQHNSYNHFLAVIDIITNNSDAAPKTKTSKNGIRAGDEKLNKLFEWIKQTMPYPEKKASSALSERQLVAELAKLKATHIPAADKRVETEFYVYNNTVRVDMYLYDGSNVYLYEAKKGNADIKDFYQLLMYWDGFVNDNLTPFQGVLLAETFSEGVANIITLFNSKRDSNGNLYNFVMKTWKSEGINI